MQISKVLAIVTAVYTSSASAKCFQRGQHWGDHEIAISKLRDACNSMKGHYQPGEVFSQCRNGLDFKSFKFEIQNNNDYGVDVSYEACVKTISREIEHCGHGGQETFNDVRYRYVLLVCFLIQILPLLKFSGVIPTRGSARFGDSQGIKGLRGMENIRSGDRMGSGRRVHSWGRIDGWWFFFSSPRLEKHNPVYQSVEVGRCQDDSSIFRYSGHLAHPFSLMYIICAATAQYRFAKCIPGIPPSHANVPLDCNSRP